MFKTIVWGTDGSETADRALPYAKALTEAGNGALVVVHCKEMWVGRAAGYPMNLNEEELEEKIRGQVDELRAGGLEVTLELATSAGSRAAHRSACPPGVTQRAVRNHRHDTP